MLDRPAWGILWRLYMNDLVAAPVRRIAVLEDDADLRSLLRDMVAALGGECRVSAASLAEFRSLAGEVLGCDLAILDVNLGPGAPSGVDAYTWLREHGFRGAITFLTGHARSHPMVQAALSQEGVSVLQKPVDFSVIEALIQGTQRQSEQGKG